MFQSPKIGSVVSNSQTRELVNLVRDMVRFNPLKSGQLFQILGSNKDSGGAV